MNHPPDHPTRGASRDPSAEPGRRGTLFLFLLFFLLGITVSAFWFYGLRKQLLPKQNYRAFSLQASGLSDLTRSVLQRLNSSVEIRYYALLDPEAASESLRTFASGVDRLLAEYESASGGRLRVIRRESESDFTQAGAEASADGLQQFNLDKGNGCYLGIAVSANGRRETLARLDPEWGQALEPDLSRAIERVSAPSASEAPATLAASRNDAEALEQVRKAIPNLDSISLADGTRILRESALKDFQDAVKEMEGQIREVQQRLNQAQSGGTEADQQAAIKQLQQLQSEQAEKLRQIAAQSQAQVQALQRFKSGSP